MNQPSSGLIRSFLRIFAPSLAVISLAAAAVWFIYVRGEEARLTNRAENALNLTENIIGTKFGIVASDLILLTENRSLKKYLQDIDETTDDFIADYIVFLRSKRDYGEIIFIDPFGIEISRIKREPDGTIISHSGEDRVVALEEYFYKTLLLKDGDIYISPFFLDNDESAGNGEFSPAVYFGVPIFDSEGNKRGVMLIEYHAPHLLDEIRETMSTAPGGGMLLDKKGQWLIAPDFNDEWGLFSGSGVTFAKRYPDAWKRIEKEKGGTFTTDKGKFIFKTSFPQFDVHMRYTEWRKHGHRGKPGADGLKTFRVTLVSRLDVSSFYSMSSREARAGIAIYLLAVLILAAVSVMLVRAWAVREKAEKVRAQFQTTLDKTLDCVFMFRPGTLRFFYVNQGAMDQLGYTHDEMMEMTPVDIKPGFSEQSFRDIISPLIEGPQHSIMFETVHEHRNGDHIPVEIFIQYIAPRGEDPRFVTIVRDIGNRKRDEEALRKLSRAVEYSPSIVVITDPRGVIEYVNPKFTEVTGYSLEEVTGQTPRILGSGKTAKEYYVEMWQTILSGNEWRGEFTNKRKDGSLYLVAIAISPIKTEDGTITNFISVQEDITKRKQDEETLRQTTMTLDSVSRIQGFFITEEDRSKIFDRILDEIKNLTDSEYGFIGEVIYTDGGMPFLNIFAITDISWNEEMKKFYDDNAPSYMDFTNLNTLFGHTLKTGELVIANSPANDPRAGGLPEGHPPLNSYLGVPLNTRDGMVGMIGMANRPGGYDQDMLDSLLPVLTGCAQIIEAAKLQHARKEAQKEAENANKAKSEFLSSMSHELRTPLNAILGFGQMLQYNPNEPLTKTQKDCVEHILKGGDHLLELINEVLDLAKIEAGKMTISMESVEPREVFEECLTLVEDMADKRNIKIIAPQPGTEHKTVRADYTRLKQVLLNLLSNAIKYNRDGGRVELSCANRPGGMLRVSVIDNGPGIEEEKQSQLFVPFSRLGAETSNIEGTGIGLTVTRKLMELMGGEIGFESEEGKGATFWIELALVDGEEKEPAVTAGEDRAAKVFRGQSLAGTVLCVEDNAANIQLIEMVVGRIDGLELMTARSAEEGLKIVNSRKPDVILMDINLPGMDGYKALEVLHSDPESRKIPVIALTAAATEEDLIKGRKAGFTDYITKPIQVDEVLKSIRKALGPVDN